MTPAEHESMPAPATAPHDSEQALLEEVIAPLREVHHAPPGGRLAKLATGFFDESARCQAELRHAAHAGDAAETARLAHALNGASAIVGARLLPELCRRLERMATSDDMGGAGTLLDAIDAELERVRVALRDEFLPASWPPI